MARFTLDFPASVMVAFGSAVLAYRVWLSLRGDFSAKVREVAEQSTVQTTSTWRGDPLIGGLSIASTFNFERGRIAIRRRIEAWMGIILVVIGTACSLASLLARRESAGPAVITGAAVGGIILAWALTHGYSYLWRRFRESPWLDHAWLDWLERQIPDPFDLGSDLVTPAQVSPHPGLEHLLDSIQGAERWLGHHGQETERWIADLAVRCKHRFASEKWREWVSRARSPGR